MVLAVEAGPRLDHKAVEKWMLWTIVGGLSGLARLPGVGMDTLHCGNRYTHDHESFDTKRVSGMMWQ